MGCQWRHGGGSLQHLGRARVLLAGRCCRTASCNRWRFLWGNRSVSVEDPCISLAMQAFARQVPARLHRPRQNALRRSAPEVRPSPEMQLMCEELQAACMPDMAEGCELGVLLKQMLRGHQQVLRGCRCFLASSS